LSYNCALSPRLVVCVDESSCIRRDDSVLLEVIEDSDVRRGGERARCGLGWGGVTGLVFDLP